MTTELDPEAARKLYRHKKRGTTYRIRACGKFQYNNDPDIIAVLDNTTVIIYQCLEDKSFWVRPIGEFFDGRYEELDHE